MDGGAIVEENDVVGCWGCVRAVGGVGCSADEVRSDEGVFWMVPLVGAPTQVIVTLAGKHLIRSPSKMLGFRVTPR